MLFERAALPIGRAITVNAIASSDTFGVLGPFSGVGMLRSLEIGFASTSAGVFRVGACLTASPQASLVNWSSSAALFDVGGGVLAGKPMIEMRFPSTGESNFFTFELWRPFETGAQYVIVAVSLDVAVNSRFTFNALWEPIAVGGGARRARAE